MAKKYTITLDNGIAKIVDDAAKKLEIRPTKYCRDLIVAQLNDMSLITSRIKN